MLFISETPGRPCTSGPPHTPPMKATKVALAAGTPVAGEPWNAS